jgi:Ran GTPase-activating protein (RanGAP) involved in mRNA processing and transport
MNVLGSAGCGALGSALERNRTLTSLDLNGNGIPAGAGLEALGTALRANKALTTLDLSYNPLGKEGGRVIADAVKYSGSLETLRMGWCKLEKGGGAAFGDCLRSNAALAVLDLRGNNLGDEGVAALAGALQFMNETLTQLDVGYNEIKDKGAFALAQALKANENASIDTVGVANNYLVRPRPRQRRRRGTAARHLPVRRRPSLARWRSRRLQKLCGRSTAIERSRSRSSVCVRRSSGARDCDITYGRNHFIALQPSGGVGSTRALPT